MNDDRLTDTTLGTRIKVCGIVDRTELDLLRTQGVDFVGLWWGVPGGPHDLDRERWARPGARGGRHRSARHPCS